MTATMRFTSSVVLPVPAAASTISVSSSELRIASRALMSFADVLSALTAGSEACLDWSDSLYPSCTSPGSLHEDHKLRGTRKSHTLSRLAPPAKSHRRCACL